MLLVGFLPISAITHLSGFQVGSSCIGNASQRQRQPAKQSAWIALDLYELVTDKGREVTILGAGA